MVTDLTDDLSSRMVLWDFSTLFRLFDWRTLKIYENRMIDCIKAIKELFGNHMKNYHQSNEGNICDFMITAKNKALRRGKVSSSNLINDNLAICMFDILFGGSHSTAMTFVWALLFMTYYPDIYQKLKEEIETQIGYRIPTLEDEKHCHYLMAFINETLRMRNVIHVGLPHKTLSQSKIGCKKLNFN